MKQVDKRVYKAFAVLGSFITPAFPQEREVTFSPPPG